MLDMFRNRHFKYLFFSCLTPLCLLFIYGCNNKKIEVNQFNNNTEVVDKIESVAALGQLNPLGEVRKLAAPNSGKGGTPRISQLLVNDVGRVVAAVLFYVIWITKDVMLLLLYLCLLKKIGLY